MLAYLHDELVKDEKEVCLVAHKHSHDILII